MHLGSLLESETVVERQLRMSGQQGPRQGHGATVTNKQLKKQNSKKRTQILASVIPALPLRASQNDPQKKHGLWGFDSRHPSLLAKNRVFCCCCCWWWWSNNSLNNEISPPVYIVGASQLFENRNCFLLGLQELCSVIVRPCVSIGARLRLYIRL